MEALKPPKKKVKYEYPRNRHDAIKFGKIECV